VKSSFKNTGIYPSNKEIIWENAELNAGKLPTSYINDTEVTKRCRELTEEIIDDAMEKENKVEKIKVYPPKAFLFSGKELLAHSRQVKEEKAREKLEKKAAAAAKKESKLKTALEKAAAKAKALEEKVRLAAEKESRKREMEEEKAATSAEKTKITCKGTHKKIKVWNGEKTWLWCENCDGFGMCAKCHQETPSIMHEHERDCVPEGSRKRRR
jgi:hypothetical protein